MQLQQLLVESFPDGLPYNEMAQLCLWLYSADCGFPEELAKQCNKRNLPVVFAQLASSGFLLGEADTAVLYGANFHDVIDKGHWVEVIASIFKIGKTVDMKMGPELAARLTRR